MQLSQVENPTKIYPMFFDTVNIPNSSQSIELNAYILVISSTPLDGAHQVHIHHSFPLPVIEESLLISSGSFEDSYPTNNQTMERQTRTRSIISTISESNGKTPLITPTHPDSLYSTRF